MHFVHANYGTGRRSTTVVFKYLAESVLPADSLYGDAGPSAFARSVYVIRSKLTHDGYAPLGADLSVMLAELTRFTRDLLLATATA